MANRTIHSTNDTLFNSNNLHNNYEYFRITYTTIDYEYIVTQRYKHKNPLN